MYHHDDASPPPTLPDGALVVFSSTHSGLELKIDPVSSLHDDNDETAQRRALQSLSTAITSAPIYRVLTISDTVLQFELIAKFAPFECDRMCISMNFLSKVANFIETIQEEVEEGNVISLVNAALSIFAHVIAALSTKRAIAVNATQLFLTHFPAVPESVCSAIFKTTKEAHYEIISQCLPHIPSETVERLMLRILGYTTDRENCSPKESKALVAVLSSCALPTLKLTNKCEESFHEKIQKRMHTAIQKKEEVFTFNRMPLNTLLCHFGNLRLAKNTETMNALLHFACCHPDSVQKRECMMLIANIATPEIMRAVSDLDDRAPLLWWTDRCLPKWVDVLSASTPWMGSGASPQLVKTIHRLLLFSKVLPAPYMPDISLFAMKLFDSGGLTKLQAVADGAKNDAPLPEFFDILSHMNGALEIAKKLEIIPWSSDCASPEYRAAVCAIFSAPLYKHPRTGEWDRLPGEVAHHICSYMPTRAYFSKVKWRTGQQTHSGAGFGSPGFKSSGFGKQAPIAGGFGASSGFGKKASLAGGFGASSGFGKKASLAGGFGASSGFGKKVPCADKEDVAGDGLSARSSDDVQSDAAKIR